MSSAVGRERELIDVSQITEDDFLDAGAACAKWEHFPASALSHHGERCCDVAREWVIATDFSQLEGGALLAGPRWLRRRYEWGPSRWPLHWCEAVERKTLDCGALAALSCEVFAARGLTAFPAQLVQHYSVEATLHWRQRWEGDETSTHWIDDDLIYHEGSAVLVSGREIKLWDASAGWWVSPRQRGGYGTLVGLRVFAPAEQGETFTWGHHEIAANRWQKIARV
jgi:hypothetical protein